MLYVRINVALEEDEAVWIRCMKSFGQKGKEVFWVFMDLNIFRHLYPAVYEVERSKGYRNVDEIKPSQSLVELYQKAAQPTLIFESIVSPMVCPPIPWVSTKLGGYLVNNAKIVR